MNIIAIDCGASFIKACLFDEKGDIKKEFVSDAPKPMGSELDVLNIRQMPALIKITEEAIDSLSGECSGRIGLSISNEMHGFLLCNEDGSPYCDYISWQKEFGNIDTPFGKPVDSLSENFTNEIKKSGMPLRAGLPLANLLYLKYTGLLDKAERLRFYTLGDYILQHFAEDTVACHPSNAAATGIYDILSGDWNWKLVDYVCGANVKFPQIGDEPFYFRYKAKEFMAVLAIGDYQAAMLGAGINDSTTLSLNIATGAQASCLIEQFSLNELDSKIQIVPFFDHKYLRRVAFIPSGRSVNIYIHFIKDILKTFDIEIKDDDIWNKIVTILRNGEDKRMSFDLSFFENALTDDTVGSIDNIEEAGLTFDNFINSLFSCLADGYLKCADRIFPNRFDVSKIIMTGGLVRKLKYIQDRIREHYGDGCTYEVVSNETLTGNRLHLMNIIDTL